MGTFFPLIRSLPTILSSPQTVFVGLMNTSEKKPFGGFFGSFILIEYTPRTLPKRTLNDSYTPQSVSSYRFALPDYYAQIMPAGDGAIGILGANMLGRTKDDAKTMRSVYQQIYQKPLDWVVLVDYTLFAAIIPDWEQRTRKREFLNATVDLRRGAALPNKKEDSFADISAIVANPWYRIQGIRAVIKNVATNNRAGKMHIDPPASLSGSAFSERLEDKGWVVIYNSQSLYLGEYNLSFNKIDKFVQTTTIIDGPGGQTSRDNVSIFSDVMAGPGNYTLTHTIQTTIPDNYPQTILQREKDYDITLTEREKTILSLDPQFHRRLAWYLPPQSINITLLGDNAPTFSVINTEKFAIVVMDSMSKPPQSSTFSLTFSVPKE